MASLEPLDSGYPLSKQMEIDAAPIVLVNLCTMAPEDEEAFLTTWAADAAYMKRQPGFISTQHHRALGESPTYLNYAVFESAETWRNAFHSPEFKETAKAHPASVVFRPHLFQKVAVPNLCTA